MIIKRIDLTSAELTCRKLTRGRVWSEWITIVMINGNDYGDDLDDGDDDDADDADDDD